MKLMYSGGRERLHWEQMVKELTNNDKFKNAQVPS